MLKTTIINLTLNIILPLLSIPTSMAQTTLIDKKNSCDKSFASMPLVNLAVRTV